MLLCGLLPLLGAALTLLLPETANQPLPDSVQDVEGHKFSDEDGGGPSFFKACPADFCGSAPDAAKPSA